MVQESRVLYGNLIDFAEKGEVEVIVHGCNCFCNMGAGIAKEIKRRYPAAYDMDCTTTKGDRAKLGGYTWINAVAPNKHPFIIVNAYTQYAYGNKSRNVDYEAVRSVFSMIKSVFKHYHIGYPYIGAGLAGGDWNIISRIINSELAGMTHTLVEYKR